MKLHVICLLSCSMLVGSSARADKKPRLRLQPVVGRVVDLEVTADYRIVTVLAGSEQGITRGAHAKFRDVDGEAIIVRVDHRTTVVKTSLSAERVRAHRSVQFDPAP